MGFNTTSAGGLMGMDFVAVPSMTHGPRGAGQVGQSASLQPEALTSVHAVDDDGACAAWRRW